MDEWIGSPEWVAQREEDALMLRLSDYALGIKADRIPTWLIDLLLGVRSD